MSIVERAAEKLRQTDSQTRPEPATDSRDNTPAPDHVAAAGQRLAARGGDAPPAAVRSDEPDAEAPRSKLAIDFKALRRAGLVPPVSEEEQVAREYKRIKRPLLANAEGGGIGTGNDRNCCMVASAIPGEGKTFTAVNLALSLAKERDYKVVLIDGDVIKPSISRALGVKDRLGLTDILADTTLSDSDAILQTNVPRLSFLPAGQRHEDATELLASQRMSWFINKMDRDPNQVVIMDSPPLLATAESQAMAMAVGQILVVVKAASTNRNAVMSALSLVATPNKNVSLILNQSTKAHGDYYAGYYGGYYDGHDTGA